MLNKTTIKPLTEDEIKLIINALHQYRRKLQPANPKAVQALALIDYLKSVLDKEKNDE